MKLAIFFLTCANNTEADKITEKLLEKKLVFCVKKTSVSSSFLWKGKTESSKEVLLVMDALEEKFDDIDREISNLHSYDTYVLTAVPVIRTTDAVLKWVKQATG